MNKSFSYRRIQSENELISYIDDYKLGMILDDVSENYQSNNSRRICSSIFRHSRLAKKGTIQQSFVDMFTNLNQYNMLDVKLDSTVSIITALVVDNFVELWGFANPKIITYINFNDNNLIRFFEFNNDSSQIWPRKELAQYNGNNIDHSIFFSDKTSAEEALTMILLSKTHDIEIRNHVKL